MFRYQPGPDGQFGTSDDVRNNFDVGVYGARDPEGMGYDPVRDTILIVDDGSKTIYEMDKTGALLNTISIAGHGVVAAAGLAVAPGSSNASQRNYYVVARGLDNDSHPTENDGMLYEFSATLPRRAHQPGTHRERRAGPDRHPPERGNPRRHGHRRRPAEPARRGDHDLGEGDRLRDVIFGNPNAVDTTAQFSVEGTYVLRLTASDGQASVADEITVTVAPHVTGAFTKSVVAVGERTRFKGTVSPAAAGQPVLLQRRKGGKWVRVADQAPRGRPLGLRVQDPSGDSGRYRYRTFVPAYAGTPSAAFGGPAKGRLLRVYRAEITAVHHGGDEFVVIANTGAVPMDIDGWLLVNKGTGTKRTLPSMVVRPGHVVRIHSGAGKSDKNDLYLNRQDMWGAARHRGAAQRQVGAAGQVELLREASRPSPREAAAANETRRGRGC